LDHESAVRAVEEDFPGFFTLQSSKGAWSEVVALIAPRRVWPHLDVRVHADPAREASGSWS